MKHILVLVPILFMPISFAQPASRSGGQATSKPVAAKPGASAAAPAQVSREKALEYLKLTGRTNVMEKAYKARFVEAKGALPVSEELKKKHLNEINELLIRLVQKSFSPVAMDAAIAFLKTPGGERWAEDAAEFNEEFRDETAEVFGKFTEEIKDAREAAQGY